MKKQREFKLPNRRQPVFRIVRAILRSFICPKVEVLNLAGEMDQKCIIVANHSAKNGAIAYDSYLPVFNAKWGAHQMLGGYRERRDYLMNVFYIQKMKMNRVKANFKASFEAIFSGMIYKGLKIVGTYPDVRLKKTLTESKKLLDANIAVTIFPEDSSLGYFDQLDKFFSGFVVLAEHYYKNTGEDLPIYPVYYNHKNRKMVIASPERVQDLKKNGLDKEQIAEHFRNRVNQLYNLTI